MNKSVDVTNLVKALRGLAEFVLAKNPGLRKYRFAIMAGVAAAGYVAGDLTGSPVVQETLTNLCGD